MIIGIDVPNKDTEQGEEKDSKEKDKCAVCRGKGLIEVIDTDCPYCNGTGEYTKLADKYFKDHNCQCVFYDRRNCLVCGKKCHHNTPFRPHILIAPKVP